MKNFLLFITLSLFIVAGCRQASNPTQNTADEGNSKTLIRTSWSKNANIYEVNIRQFTPEGTFEAFRQHLPRLKNMGVDILWLMPVNPIGEKNRKGTLGSYYSIKDYKDVNPEFGSFEDFTILVNEIHELGMYVIIDWVANHTAWDNHWTTEHPEWYVKDTVTGDLLSPGGWTDVVKLDYSNQQMRKAMMESMKFWIEETDIDGFRCDVAGEVPTNFWDTTRMALEKIKPVFMLAESEKPELLNRAFDMDYAWDLLHICNKISKKEANANSLAAYFAKLDTTLPAGAIKMNFITNHDENSWNGTEYKRHGDAVETFAVLVSTIPGMPLIYSGQEEGDDHALKFFEKDPIQWGDFKFENFYKALLTLKKENKALWNGAFGGDIERITSDNDESVFAFFREKEGKAVFVILNFSPDSLQINFNGDKFEGEYTSLFGSTKANFVKGLKMELKPWDYQVWSR